MSTKRVLSVGPREWDWRGLRAVCVRETRRLLRHAAAEDAAQSALVRAWTARATCNDPLNPEAWVAQIARREALRTGSRRRERPLDVHDLSEPGESGQAWEIATIDRLQVRSVLRLLSDEDRLMLLLRYDADLTHRRVAEVLGLPEGTAKVRLHRLRGHLRTALGEHAQDQDQEGAAEGPKSGP